MTYPIDTSGWYLLSGKKNISLEDNIMNDYNIDSKYELNIEEAFVIENHVNSNNIHPSPPPGHLTVDSWTNVSQDTSYNIDLGYWVNLNLTLAKEEIPESSFVNIRTNSSYNENGIGFEVSGNTSKNLETIKIGSGSTTLDISNRTVGGFSVDASYGLQSINICSVSDKNAKPGFRSAIGYYNDGTFEYLNADTVFEPNNIGNISNPERNRVNHYMNASGKITMIREGSTANGSSYAVLDRQGRVYVWGNPDFGGLAMDGTWVTFNGNDLSNIVQIFATGSAYCALDTNGDVYTWGRWGSVVPENHTKVEKANFEDSKIRHIYTVRDAVAALDTSGSVWVWGVYGRGGLNPNNFYTPIKLKHDDINVTNIVQIYITTFTFAALDSSGYLYIWGYPGHGALSNSQTMISESNENYLETEDYYYPDVVMTDFSNVLSVQAMHHGFMALDGNNRVHAWGWNGDNVFKLPHYGILQIYSTDFNFSALNSNGEVITWGNNYRNRMSTGHKMRISNSHYLTNIVDIYTTNHVFVGLDSSGCVWTWGPANWLGDFRSIRAGKIKYQSNEEYQSNDLSNIVQIYSTLGAFAALDTQGYVYVWGDPKRGGLNINDRFTVEKARYQDNYLNNIVQIYNTHRAFAALDTQGHVYVWGDPSAGGITPNDFNTITKAECGGQPLSNIVHIIGTAWWSFVALDNNGYVYVWGNRERGGLNYASYTEIFKPDISNIVMMANPYINYRLLGKPKGTITISGEGLTGTATFRFENLYNIDTDIDIISQYKNNVVDLSFAFVGLHNGSNAGNNEYSGLTLKHGGDKNDISLSRITMNPNPNTLDGLTNTYNNLNTFSLRIAIAAENEPDNKPFRTNEIFKPSDLNGYYIEGLNGYRIDFGIEE